MELETHESLREVCKRILTEPETQSKLKHYARIKNATRREGLRTRDEKVTLTGKGTHCDEGSDEESDIEEFEQLKAKKQKKKKRAGQGDKSNRKPWQPHEDEKLKELISQHGKKWSVLSKLMGGVRTGKQIRDRWVNKLDTAIEGRAWTAKEDEMILTLWQEVGNRWADISKLFEGRTESMVKNRFYSHLFKHRIGKNGEILEEPKAVVESHKYDSEIHCDEYSEDTQLQAKMEDESEPVKHEYSQDIPQNSCQETMDIIPKCEETETKQESSFLPIKEEPNTTATQETNAQTAVFATVSQNIFVPNQFPLPFWNALGLSSLAQANYKASSQQILAANLPGLQKSYNALLNASMSMPALHLNASTVLNSGLSQKGLGSETGDTTTTNNMLSFLFDTRSGSNSSTITTDSFQNYLSQSSKRG